MPCFRRGGGNIVMPAKHLYDKEWRSIKDQVALLYSRGLHIPDLSHAEAFLLHFNYYRFSGYCLAFESSRHVFHQGVNFPQVEYACDFDRQLRDCVAEALEVVELDIRAVLAHTFTQTHGPFGHTDERNFFRWSIENHAKWLVQMRDYAQNSSETFVRHFRIHCSEYPDLPLWVLAELMSFGSLSRLYGHMHKSDQKKLSHRYGLQPHILASWLHHFVYLRNICAHHGRLWDKDLVIKPILPPSNDWADIKNSSKDKVFCSLLMLHSFLIKCPAAGSFVKDWAPAIEKLLQHLPQTSNTESRMGLTDSGLQHPLWIQGK